MGGLIPLSDASRRPASIPVVTVFIILVNAFVFVLELMNGEAFVTQWSVVPAQITSGHHWITILTAMFMHGSWAHIIGNMIFLWHLPPRSKMRWAEGATLSSICLAGSWQCWPRSQPILIPRFRTWARAARLPQ